MLRPGMKQMVKDLLSELRRRPLGPSGEPIEVNARTPGRYTLLLTRSVEEMIEVSKYADECLSQSPFFARVSYEAQAGVSYMFTIAVPVELSEHTDNELAELWVANINEVNPSDLESFADRKDIADVVVWPSDRGVYATVHYQVWERFWDRKRTSLNPYRPNDLLPAQFGSLVWVNVGLPGEDIPPSPSRPKVSVYEHLRRNALIDMTTTDENGKEVNHMAAKKSAAKKTAKKTAKKAVKAAKKSAKKSA